MCDSNKATRNTTLETDLIGFYDEFDEITILIADRRYSKLDKYDKS